MKIADLPVVGALVKGKDGGYASSEFGFAGLALATILTLNDVPGWAKALGVAVIAAGYCLARGTAKREK